MFIIYKLGRHKLTVKFGNMKQAGKQTQNFYYEKIKSILSKFWWIPHDGKGKGW